jgi:hypothetical protein
MDASVKIYKSCFFIHWTGSWVGKISYYWSHYACSLLQVSYKLLKIIETKMTVFWNVEPCSLVTSGTQVSQCLRAYSLNVLEDGDGQNRHRENLKYHLLKRSVFLISWLTLSD